VDTVVEIGSWGFLLAGAFFVVTGGVGLIRFPDFFTRLHPAGVTDTMGAGLTLIGLMLQAGFTSATIKLALILGFILLTSPAATHALAQAALRGNVRPKTRDTSS